MDFSVSLTNIINIITNPSAKSEDMIELAQTLSESRQEVIIKMVVALAVAIIGIGVAIDLSGILGCAVIAGSLIAAATFYNESRVLLNLHDFLLNDSLQHEVSGRRGEARMATIKKIVGEGTYFFESEIDSVAEQNRKKLLG